MIKIENIVTPSPAQWEAAIRGMRNPMNSWAMSDTTFYDYEEGEYHDICGNNGPSNIREHIQMIMGAIDLDLMQRLCDAGSEHRKFLRMLPVVMDITAPLYLWKEIDQYRVGGTTTNSTSTMHKIHAKEFTLDDFSCEHLMDNEAFAFPLGGGWRGLNAMEILKCTIEGLNNARKRYLETKDKKYWWQMIQLLPTSYNQKRTLYLNYETLRTMHYQRKNHKLDEWREFCKFIESLPYAAKLIVGKKEARANE